MSLRDQPYLPLYIQDIMTDEKLNECCASTHGIYIKGIMCLMHKSEPYGKILLKQKYKQNESKELGFALMLSKHLPYEVEQIHAALKELIAEDVCQFEDDYLVQKRMVRDGELSLKRSKSGKVGGDANALNFAKAKKEANAEYEIVNENVTISLKEEGLEEGTLLCPKMVRLFKESFKEYPISVEDDFKACGEIIGKIAKSKGWPRESTLNGNMENLISEWKNIIFFVKSDSWFSGRSITDLNKEFQRLIQKMSNNGTYKQTTSRKSTGAEGILGKLKDDLATKQFD